MASNEDARPEGAVRNAAGTGRRDENSQKLRDETSKARREKQRASLPGHSELDAQWLAAVARDRPPRPCRDGWGCC